MYDWAASKPSSTGKEEKKPTKTVAYKLDEKSKE